MEYPLYDLTETMFLCAKEKRKFLSLNCGVLVTVIPIHKLRKPRMLLLTENHTLKSKKNILRTEAMGLTARFSCAKPIFKRRGALGFICPVCRLERKKYGIIVE